MKVDFAKLDRAFSPRCVVVVGDNEKNDYRWLRALSTFKGHLYSIQINPKAVEDITAMGVKNYTSLLDVPEPVDLVIMNIPRAIAPRLLEDCIRKDVAAVHFFTAGFSETGTEEGIKLERQIKERAEQANMHLIGPNCVGIFNPKLGVRQVPEQYTGSFGPVGFISQSGTFAEVFSREAHIQGVDVSKLVSFGNGLVLDSTDYLEYFNRDPEIKIIGMYLEGVKDGRRFLKVLKETTSRKPVVILKGGRTEEGGRAIASHTGSLALPQAVWDAAVRQAGAVEVDNIEELIDTVQALMYLAPVHGEKVGIVGGSGGQSVAIADVFAESGLKVPPLTKKSYDELASFFILVGGAYTNPIDTGNPNREQMRRIISILEQDANVDNLVMIINARTRFINRFTGPEQMEAHINTAIDMKKKTNKPFMAIMAYSFAADEIEQVIKVIRKLQGGGIPAFVTLQRGAKALKNILDYYRFKNGSSAG